MAAGGVVAVHTLFASDGHGTTSYIHSDHLGSSDAITDDTGAVAQVMSFDTFGLRRSPTDWSYSLNTTDIIGSTVTNGLKSITDRGFTNQEQLDSVGLVHMNGRVYDPSIGRMISADPTIPNPMYSQASNRYAYVYNNPLAATDASGFYPTMWGEGRYGQPTVIQPMSDSEKLIVSGSLQLLGVGALALLVPGSEAIDAGLVPAALASIDLGSQGLSDINSGITNTPRTDALVDMYGNNGATAFKLTSAAFDVHSLTTDRSWANLFLTMGPYALDEMTPDNNVANRVVGGTAQLGEISVTASRFRLPAMPLNTITSAQLVGTTYVASDDGQVYGGTAIIKTKDGFKMWVDSSGSIVATDNFHGDNAILSQMNSVDGAATWDGVMFGGGPNPPAVSSVGHTSLYSDSPNDGGRLSGDCHITKSCN